MTTNFEKIKQSKNIENMIKVLSNLIYIAYTSKEFKSTNDLKQWLESESEDWQ